MSDKFLPICRCEYPNCTFPAFIRRQPLNQNKQMTTNEASEEFDDAAWAESMRYLPNLNHRDFWRMYCAGWELTGGNAY